MTMQDERLEKIMGASENWHIQHLKRKIDYLYEQLTERYRGEPPRNHRGEYVIEIPIAELEFFIYDAVTAWMEGDRLHQILMAQVGASLAPWAVDSRVIDPSKFK